VKRSGTMLLIFLFLASCAPNKALAPTATQAPSLSATPIQSPTPSPSTSPIPVLPWVGAVYFDKNYSGEKDPEEQALSGFTVCVMKDCGITDLEGKFSIPNTTGKVDGALTFTDPKQGPPDAMTLFVELSGTKVVPAYNENGVSIPEQHLKDFSYPNQFPITSGQMQDIGLVKSEQLNNCPVDRSSAKGYNYIYHVYVKGDHEGLDVAAAHGTHLLSPGKCYVKNLHTDTYGGDWLSMQCYFNPTRYVNLGHEDFKLNNYDTLSWYGIPKNAFYNDDGTLKLGEYVNVTKNSSVYPGQDLHLNMDCTGMCSEITHVHISVNTPDGLSMVDPTKFLACTKK